MSEAEELNDAAMRYLVFGTGVSQVGIIQGDGQTGERLWRRSPCI